jgi:hypothetical protein
MGGYLMEGKVRFAVRELMGSDPIEVASKMERYMPSNYSVSPARSGTGEPAVLIVGQDSAGWTLTDYVIPRLASGLYFAREISAAEAAEYERI